MEEKLKVVRMFFPDNAEYWCQLKEMPLVLAALRIAHPEWLDISISLHQVDMSADEYYRRPATNDTVTAAVEVVRATEEAS